MSFTKVVPVTNDIMRAGVKYGNTFTAQLITGVSTSTDSYTGKNTYTLTGATNTVVVTEDYLILNFPAANGSGPQHWVVEK